jgi:hypothetical protein
MELNDQEWGNNIQRGVKWGIKWSRMRQRYSLMTKCWDKRSEGGIDVHWVLKCGVKE